MLALFENNQRFIAASNAPGDVYWVYAIDLDG